MTKILTSSQAEELHKSIIAYLSSINASRSCEVLREELQVDSSFDDALCRKYEGLLEKKWTGIARLQKKILDLESKLSGLQTELDTISPTARSTGKDPINWLPTSSRHTFESHRDAVTCVAFHPVFTSLASGSEDCTIKIWDWELGELERTLKGHMRPVSDLDFGGQKGHTILASCSSDLQIKLWDPNKDYANVRTLSGHDHSVSAVRFLRQTDNILISASRDATIRIWDVSTGYCVKVIDSQGSWINDVSPSFDGKWLVTGGRDQAAMVWEVASAKSVASLIGHENFIECCVFAPPSSYKHLAAIAGLKTAPPASSSSEFIATGARDKTIKLWESRGRLIKTLVGHDNWVRGLLFHPGGKYLISVADDKTIRCWDLSQGGRLVKTINAHGHFVSCIRWGPVPVSDVPVETSESTKSSKTDSVKPGFQCVIATGSADSSVRIFT
ncbi:WD40 repeat domain-containing protein [Aspergillus vadensis CBS 113365]|uniref:Nuclear distribution protein nudF n=1 Tax=Aspergillus vadensis (strain CBS 113365 / IMI 142717 / IBT 24658) TaxID=1448311 RepID=A0A319B1A6_ASPVC|nr:nuclear migration protein NudF [Aspergillus vadensis CBS 113365]PYH66436.1 nuclear migration protein NudF [Aspergillus vadensis CBS 113365]